MILLCILVSSDGDESEDRNSAGVLGMVCWRADFSVGGGAWKRNDSHSISKNSSGPDSDSTASVAVYWLRVKVQVSDPDSEKALKVLTVSKNSLCLGRRYSKRLDIDVDVEPCVVSSCRSHDVV